MTSVTPIPAPALPDMTVIELSVIVSLLTDGPSRLELVRRAIEEWFVRPVRAVDLEPFLGRLTARGWVSREASGALAPSPSAEPPTLLLYAGIIRMIGAVESDAARARSLQPRDMGKGDET